MARVDGSSPDQAAKILFAYSVCGLGGVETSILNKMKALGDRGVEARALFETFWGGGGQSVADHPGVLVEGSRRAKHEFLRRWSPDAVVVIDSPWLLELVAESGLRCPVFLETHLSDPEALERRVL